MGTAEAGIGGFTDRQAAFIDHYVTDCHMNATQAAIAAGYEDGHGITVTAHRVLHHPKVREEIARRLKEHHMEANELLAIIAQDARGLFGEYLDENGELDILAMRKDGVLSLIEQIVPTKYGTSYKGPSRQRAQAMLIKILGLDKTRHEISGPDGGPIAIKAEIFSDQERLKRIEALLQEHLQDGK